MPNEWQYIGSLANEARHATPKERNADYRPLPRIMDLPRQAAEQEHRSLASMIEVLVRDYARRRSYKRQRPCRIRGTRVICSKIQALIANDLFLDPAA